MPTARGSLAQNGPPQGSSASGSFIYTDNEGPEQIAIADEGADPATGSERIGVQISQNGLTYSGAGFEYQLDKPSLPDVGPTTLIAFAVRGPGGQTYQFRARVQVGGFVLQPVYGTGASELAVAGMDLQQWVLKGG